MKLLLSKWLVAAVATCNLSAALQHRDAAIQGFQTIPSAPATGDSTANFLSSMNGLDGPKLSIVNSTSFDWWYFDAVSPDLKTSIVIVFYASGSSSLPGSNPSSDVTFISVTATFSNGSTKVVFLNADEAIVLTTRDGSSGYYEGTGAAWIGTPDLSSYLITIDSPENGVVGSFELKSIAPAHYPCGPVEAGQNMMVGPNIGWANAIPDAIGIVDVTINGSSLAFTGVGYHDKNWSNQPLQYNVGTWYWGHGRLAEYSIVWFDFLAPNGTEYVSAYAAKDGQIITASCDMSSIRVRPTGRNDDYPPKISSGNPGGFTGILNLGIDGVLNFNVSADNIIGETGSVYTRWVGNMGGNLNEDGDIMDGVALFEEFRLTA